MLCGALNFVLILREKVLIFLLIYQDGHFKQCQIEDKQKALKTMYALLSKCKNLQLPIDIQLVLFVKTVVPILLYGCEIQGITKCDIIEAVHLKFCKLVLKVKSRTPNCMIYGELGRLPLHLVIKQRVISYWPNLIMQFLFLHDIIL